MSYMRRSSRQSPRTFCAASTAAKCRKPLIECSAVLQCSELLEVVYPEWASAPPGFALRLKEIWRERRGSSLPENASGVWRFRELLPQVDRQQHRHDV